MGNVKIVGRVVIVTGPVSTGKGSLCRKICEQYDEGFSSVVTMKRANPNNAASIGAVLNANKKVKASISAGKLTIIRVEGMTYEHIVSLISSIRVMEYVDKITLVKINIPEELHIDYWKRNRKQSKITFKRLKRERADYKKIVDAKDFVDSKVSCVEINDPEDVVFEF